MPTEAVAEETPATVRVIIYRGPSAAYIYDVPQQWAPDPALPGSYHWARHYGTAVAHMVGDIWFEGDGWTRVFPEEKIAEILEAIPAKFYINGEKS